MLVTNRLLLHTLPSKAHNPCSIYTRDWALLWLRHPNVRGTHRKPKAPGEVNVPQQVFHQRQRSLLQYLLSGNALLSGITHTNSGTLRKFLHKGRSP